jgi:hypothetical protein
VFGGSNPHSKGEGFSRIGRKLVANRRFTIGRIKEIRISRLLVYKIKISDRGLPDWKSSILSIYILMASSVNYHIQE